MNLKRGKEIKLRRYITLMCLEVDPKLKQDSGLKFKKKKKKFEIQKK